MGLLDKLWDDTLAGPRPDSGLSKLRKHNTFSFRSTKEEVVGDDVASQVTRSIMIKRPTSENRTPPLSPAESTPPVSPFAGGAGVGSGGKERSGRFRRKSSSDAYEGPLPAVGMVGVGPRGPPTPYEV